MTKLSMSEHEQIPVVYSYGQRLLFDSGTQVGQDIESFILELSRVLKEKGCSVIGHIKGYVETEADGSILFNLTSFDQEISFRGQLPDSPGDCRLALNVIVYGIAQEQVKVAVIDSALKFLGPATNTKSRKGSD